MRGYYKVLRVVIKFFYFYLNLLWNFIVYFEIFFKIFRFLIYVGIIVGVIISVILGGIVRVDCFFRISLFKFYNKYFIYFVLEEIED